MTKATMFWKKISSLLKDYDNVMKARFDKIAFITGNEGKAKYLSDYFHLPVERIKIDLPEIQSLDLKTIVEDKAKRAFEIVRKPVLVEDASLVFRALDNLPGPLIKWFFESIGTEGMCNLLDKYQDKRALAEVQFAIADKDGVHIFSGAIEGVISEKPRGEAGFGWDSIFVPEGRDKTRAEMTDFERHETSMRRLALEKMKKYLLKID